MVRRRPAGVGLGARSTRAGRLVRRRAAPGRRPAPEWRPRPGEPARTARRSPRTERQAGSREVSWRDGRGAANVPPPVGRGGAGAGSPAGAPAPAAPWHRRRRPRRVASPTPRRAAPPRRSATPPLRSRDPGPTELRSAASKAVRRGTAPERTRVAASRPRPDTDQLAAELGPIVGPATAPRLAEQLADASRAFEAERYADARRILGTAGRPGAGGAVGPGAPRPHALPPRALGRGDPGARGVPVVDRSTEQHPVLADSYRALARYGEVEALWAELREASPSAELVAEGRIVYAGALADQGRLVEAIAVIEPAVKQVRAPKDHHLRLLYVLADLHERAGDQPRARALFERLVGLDPDFADAAARRRAL